MLSHEITKSKTIWLVLVVVLVLILWGLMLWFSTFAPKSTSVVSSAPPAPATAPAPAPVAVPVAPAVPSAARVPESEKPHNKAVPLIAPEDSAITDLIEPVRPVQQTPPAFDVVRIEPNGNAVVAGVAAPNARVDIHVDQQKVATAQADGVGKFATLLDIPTNTQPQTMQLFMELPSGDILNSEDTIVIAPIAPPVQTVEKAVIAPIAPPVQPIEKAFAPAAPIAQKPNVFAVDKTDNVRIITPVPLPSVPSTPSVQTAQTAQTNKSTEHSNIVIDTITYGNDNSVIISGRAANPNAWVFVYLDNQFVDRTNVQPNTTWQSILDNVKAGLYILRVDEINTHGEIASRAEIPFQRETLDRIASAASAASAATPAAPALAAPTHTPAPISTAAAQTATESRISLLTVQPGFTLWGIARNHYGKGMLYVHIYQANNGQIRDPDLIYPGQIFTIPNTVNNQ